MSRSLRWILMLVFVLAVGSASSRQAAACELCRRIGSPAYHVPTVGGDESHGHEPQSAATDLDIGTAQPAFATGGGQWPQPGGPGSPITLTYSYRNMFDGGLKMPGGQPLPASVIRESIEAAFALWASVVPISFVEVPDDGLEYHQGTTQFGRLRFQHTYINGPDIPGQPPTTKAQAHFPYGGEPWAGDVDFDNSDPWQVAGTLPTPDILGAATHEIGHTLGLLHSSIPQANMYWIFRRTQGLHDGWLHPDDIAGVRSIYGSGTGTVTPLPIPEPPTWLIVLSALLLLGKASRAVPAPVCRSAAPTPATR